VTTERSASRTALGTALLRAAHQVLDAPPRILEDPFAVALFGHTAIQRITSDPDAWQSPGRRGLRAHVVLRSRVAEDRLEAAVARGVTQYVLLGAGFDTFALRQPEWAKPLRIVEVDHAATQAEKQSRVAAAGLAAPANLTFATIDFERESLREGLARVGAALDVPTFFSWLGVSMYLDEPAVDALLASCGQSPAGSEIVLTFASPSDAPSAVEAAAASVGEPFRSRFQPAQLEEKLHAAGFADVGFLTRADADARYFGNRPRDLPVPRRTSIAWGVK
jgi:methyltransferase (TIGR00027 family)